MTSIDIELSEEAFDAFFPLRKNHLNPGASWDGCLFETFGEELAFVRQQDPGTVWTFLDDDNGRPCLSSGVHFVNRIGYLISTAKVPDDVFIYVSLDTEPPDEPGSTCNVHELLAGRRQVAVIWSVEDVQAVRPDLTDDEAWRVLQRCERVHDCEVGFTWLLIRTVADELFPEPEEQ